MQHKIAIVTPVKNEMANLFKLFNAMSKQTVEIFAWIIVENDSNDGSKEFLTQTKKVHQVLNLQVIHMEFEDKTYQLGTKYATIIQHGFDFLKRQPYYSEIDFIGILDSDCFPEPNYYEELTKFMLKDSKLGISSGLSILESGAPDIRNKSWVRGNSRLWKKECLETSGYIIGPSADTLSVCKAMLRGWKVYPNPNIKVVTRDLGDKVNFSYYGYSAYFRGHTLFFAVLKTIFLYLKGKKKAAKEYFEGYSKNFKKKTPRINDREVIQFYNNYLLNKVLRKLKLS